MLGRKITENSIAYLLELTAMDKKMAIKINPSIFHDLSHLIAEDMPVYPGEPNPEFRPHFSLGKDKVNVSLLYLGSHTGTHIDAPKHFFPTGNSIDKIALEKFIGEAVILDFSQGESHKILLGEGIGIIEGLNKNLKHFVGKRMFLVSLPLFLKGLDGSPARTVLFELM